MDQVETRQLVYFVTVAEELHFGHAAERLGMAQPPLSRAIARLERRVGVRLFDRTSRSVSLTAAGQEFLDASRLALGAVDLAVRRARAAGAPDVLTLALRPGAGVGIVRSALVAYGKQPGAVPVQLEFLDDPGAAVRAGSVDLALICSSADLTGFEYAEIATEEPVALLPEGHPLTRQAAVTLADLRADTRFVAECPHGSLDAIIATVSVGQLITVIGDSAADRLGATVKAVPVADAPMSRLVLVWRPGANRARREFVSAAVTVTPPDLKAVPAW